MVESPTDAQLSSRLEILGAAGWELVFARRATNGPGDSFDVSIRNDLQEA
jgi:hypothetical protein